MRIAYAPYGAGYSVPQVTFDDARNELFMDFVIQAMGFEWQSDEFMDTINSAREAAQLTIENPQGLDRHGNRFGIRLVIAT